MNGTVSIGRVGEVIWDPTGKRWKGIISERQDTLADLFGLLRGLVEGHQPQSDTLDMRLTFRVFIGPNVDMSIVRRLRLPWCGTEVSCEAIIPLGDNNGSLVYFGGNTTKRASTMETRLAEWKLYDEAIRRGRSKPRPLPIGFTIERLTSANITDGDIADLVELYAICYSAYMVKFTADVVRQMVSENVFYIVRNERGVIVCAGQAEQVSVRTVTGGVWTLVELSENATHPDCRSLGLSQLVRIAMVEAVRRPKTVIYAESRANHGAVIKANSNIGMVMAGRLDHHTYMDSTASEVAQEGSYNTLLVMHLPVAE